MVYVMAILKLLCKTYFNVAQILQDGCNEKKFKKFYDEGLKIRRHVFNIFSEWCANFPQIPNFENLLEKYLIIFNGYLIENVWRNV